MKQKHKTVGNELLQIKPESPIFGFPDPDLE